jgi:L-alanine-DL-glutamate epimerase-like enolase superfamily enzyme
MRITNLEAWPLKMQLAEPYAIAYEQVDSTTNVFLRIETNRGFVGYGCAAPDAQVTGETSETVLRICRDVIEPALKRTDPLRLAKLTENRL